MLKKALQTGQLCLVLFLGCSAARATEAEPIIAAETYALGEAIQFSASHQPNQQDPIANRLADCLEEHEDPKCFEPAIDEYRKLIDTLYTASLKANKPETQETIKRSQQAWLAYSTSQGAATSSYNDTANPGTIVRFASPRAVIGHLRGRIADLMYYLGGGQN